MGIDECHFNVSSIVRDKVSRQCPQTTTFKEKGQPKRIRTEVLLLTLSLGQTGSLPDLAKKTIYNYDNTARCVKGCDVSRLCASRNIRGTPRTHTHSPDYFLHCFTGCSFAFSTTPRYTQTTKTGSV